jgi:hypothetical protein
MQKSLIKSIPEFGVQSGKVMMMGGVVMITCHQLLLLVLLFLPPPVTLCRLAPQLQQRSPWLCRTPPLLASSSSTTTRI